MLKNEGEKPASRIFSSDRDCLSLVRCACRPRETRRPLRPIPRRLASLDVADAFAGELTRGSIGTIPETAETENTRSYQGGVWLTSQSRANRSLKRDSLLTGKRTGNFGKIGPFGKKPPARTKQNQF